MDCKSVLKSGDRVTIGDDGREYTTLVDEIFDEGNFSILQPFYRGKSVELEPGQEYKFTCVKGGGLHYFNAMVIRSDVSGSVSVVYVRYTGNYLRLQRRNAYRSRVALDIEVRKKAQGKQLPEDWSSAKTIDISESGMISDRYTSTKSTYTEMKSDAEDADMGVFAVTAYAADQLAKGRGNRRLAIKRI